MNLNVDELESKGSAGPGVVVREPPAAPNAAEARPPTVPGAPDTLGAPRATSTPDAPSVGGREGESGPGLRKPSPLVPWAVAVAATGFYCGLAAVYWDRAAGFTNDAGDYMRLAQHPLRFTRAPFGFRVLTPWIVWLSHANPSYFFAAVTIVSLAVASALLYMYLLELYSGGVAMFGTALFVVSPTTLIELKNPVDVDALFLAMMVLAFLALVRRRWWVLGVALVIGTLDKESMLFVLLPVLLVGLLDYRLRPWRRWVALVAAPLFFYALIHYTTLVFNPLPTSYNYFSSANISFVFRAQHVINGNSDGFSFLWSMIDTFGALWLLAAMNFSKASRHVRRTTIFMIPVFLTVLLATDWARMLAVGFIVIIPLVCAGGLRRPVAVVLLFFSYDALVAEGLNNSRLHVSYGLEVPLIAVSVLAALVVGWGRVRRPARVPQPVP
ncbi:MAG: hypothetical protein ACRDV4_08325, partial [Acidimicrobiales bacterium]